jgi:hypothetical protein
MKEINIAVGAFALVLLLGLPLAIWQAYCMTLVWGWYAPAGWGSLSMKASFGLALIVALLRLRAPSKNEPGLSEKISTAIIGPGVVVGFAWVGLFVFGQ